MLNIVFFKHFKIRVFKSFEKQFICYAIKFLVYLVNIHVVLFKIDLDFSEDYLNFNL